jgi:hypothetical protein
VFYLYLYLWFWSQIYRQFPRNPGFPLNFPYFLHYLTPDVDDDIFREYQLTISQVLDDEQSEEITPRINENLDDTLNAEKDLELDNELKDKSIYETPNASVTSDTFVTTCNNIRVFTHNIVCYLTNFQRHFLLSLQ